jgi:PKD repeat protein
LYEWDFDGDGTFDWSSPETGDPTYTYTSSGSHNATLRVTDDEGATDTATVTIDVNEPGGEVSVEEVRVGASSDDAEEKASGAMYLTSSDLELVHISSGDQTVGIRFVGVDIPQGATIVNAYVQFKVDETGSQDTFLTIEAQDTDNAQPFTSSKRNISNRATTVAAVDWNPEAWTKKGQTGPVQRTPDISSIIQEVVDRQGWSSGNSLVLIITGSGERVAESYNGDRNGAPLLHVEYSSTP